ncbi:serine hydrolase domain-containing protein [Comamonas sp. SY3]|uniref:serine hydrolase domain-containing protein n=1 Tax=Comamonas sp. SY3 TaxID=3243601 RepID=UPI003593D1C2
MHHSRVQPGVSGGAAQWALVAQVLNTALAEQRLVGAVVLVYQHGLALCRIAAGWADREARIAMAEDTVFRWASVSKPVVSAAVMRLVADGRVDLDEPITTWLPTFRPRLPDGREARISVRQLLSHTAGLGYRFFETDDQGPYAQAGVSDGMDASGIDLQENLRRIAKVPLLYAPGTSWGYSLAVDVLGALIEAVCNTRLPQAVEALVTRPLGMADAGFVCRDAARLATPYVNGGPVPHRLREGEVVAPFEGTVGIVYSPSRALDASAFPSGGAGMVGTADDLLRLLEALRSGQGGWLPEHLIAEMARDQTQGLELAAGPGLGFGLGFSVLRDPALAQSPESPGTWRWGGAYGHAWWVDRPRGLTVVALTNTLYEGMSGRFVTELRDAVYQCIPR